MEQKCRVCGNPTSKNGYLYRCKKEKCCAAYWDKRKVLKEDLDDKNTLEFVLERAKVPKHIKGKLSHFVYVLRLKGELNAVYVGMTGLHPLARYLNHLRGYKSSSVAKLRATALIGYEGPMTSNAAAERECALADELRLKGKLVYGGH